MLRIFLFLFFLIVLSLDARALTLDQALVQAKENNPSLRQLKLSEESASYQTTKAASGFWPHLTLRGQHLFESQFMKFPVSVGPINTDLELIQPYTDYSLRAVMNLFEGGGSVTNYQAASLQSEASTLERERAEFQLSRDLRTTFYQALGAQSLVDVADQKEKTLSEHLRDVRRSQKWGAATRYDLLRVEVQYSDVETERLSADDNLKAAKDKLARMMGVSELPEELTGQFPNLDTVTVPAKTEAEERKDIKAKELRAKGAGKMKTNSHSWWYPKINLFAEKQYYNNLDYEWQRSDAFREAHNFGISFSWEFFDGGLAWANQKQAALQKTMAEENLRTALLQRPQEIDFWSRKLKLSLSAYRAKDLSIKKSAEALRLAKVGAKAGSMTSTDQLDAELDYFQSKARLVQSQVDAIEALGQVELALGKDLGNYN
jgi:outer membrane protein TolC